MAQVGVGGGVGSGHDPDSIYGVGGEPGKDCVRLSVICDFPSSSVTHILKGVPIRHFKFRGSVRFARFFVRTAFWNLRGFGVVLDAVYCGAERTHEAKKRQQNINIHPPQPTPGPRPQHLGVRRTVVSLCIIHSLHARPPPLVVVTSSKQEVDDWIPGPVRCV